MAKRNVTEIRKLYIIQALLDCEKVHTPDLIKKVNELLNYSDQTHYGLPKLNDVNNARISPILNAMEDEENIIKSEPMPKKKSGRGFAGFRYSLVNNSMTYFNIIRKLKNYFGEDEPFIMYYNLHFKDSPFFRKFKSPEVFKTFERCIGEPINPLNKEYILEIVKLSPNAFLQIGKLWDLYKQFEEVLIAQNMTKLQYNKLLPSPFPFTFDDILIDLTNSFIKDVSISSNPLGNTSQSFDLKIKTNLELSVGEDKNYRVKMVLDKNDFNIKIE